ncbi:toprim domain-containing protein, partial [Candidatus Daviesbacteria bacterium]|nr:toprim domain-containing protein [Candidatus Daviesbacteria bacterium]
LKKRGFSTNEIIASGMGVASRRGCYDRFRGRIMFPLLDIRGRVLGFSGRILGIGDPKYINSPQTDIFDKGKFLFGLNLSKGDIKQKDEAIMVEGEMDMILSFQSQVKNIIASKGTALTQDQIDSLKKYTNNIVLGFDTDLAGDAASRRGIELLDQTGFNIKVVSLQGAKDPAEICLADPKKWMKIVEDAQPIYDYYLHSIGKRYDLKKASSKKAIFEELLPIWRKISDEVVKEHYIQKLAAYLQIKDDLIRKSLNKPQTPINMPPITLSKRDDSEVKDRHKLLEKYLVALLLHFPSDHTYIPNFPETIFTQEELKQVYVLFVLFLDGISFKGQSFKISEFIKTLPEILIPLADRLFLMQIDDKLIDPKAWQKEVETVVSELKKILIKSSLEKLSLQIKHAQEFEKIESLEILNKKFRDLSVKLKNL